MRIVLVGNPNVGKSVLFSQMTGARVAISNYPGTTVEFTRGHLTLGKERHEIIDAPGTYSLDPTCRAEEVTVKLLERADLIINVVDSTNLERNLLLTTQLLERNLPMIVALNMADEAAHKGIDVNVSRLEELLGIPIIPTVGLTGEGLKDLVAAISRARVGTGRVLSPSERWALVGHLVEQVQRITHRHHTWLDTLQDASITPFTGLPIAAVVMYLGAMLVIRVGGFLEERLLTGVIFERLYEPVAMWMSKCLGGSGFWHAILIGELSNGSIDFEESLGVLTTGVYVAFGIVLPYLLVFYALLGFLEDSGYLPRLAVMADRVMHRVGLHGYAIIPMILGFGCNVPAALAARNLETRRERFIACTLMAVAVPCMAQAALIFGLVGRQGVVYLATVFATLFLIWSVLGLLLDRTIPGYTPSMIIEIPPYRLPHLRSQLSKAGMRMQHFFRHAIPYILGGIFVMNLLYIAGVIEVLAGIFAPLATGLLGLPKESISALLIGFLRKDVAIAMLEPLGLSAKQFVVAATVLTAYFPCAATFTVLLKELGPKDMALSATVMILTALSAGFALNKLLSILAPGYLVALLIGLAFLSNLAFGGTSDRRELSSVEEGTSTNGWGV